MCFSKENEIVKKVKCQNLFSLLFQNKKKYVWLIFQIWNNYKKIQVLEINYTIQILFTTSYTQFQQILFNK